MIGNKKTLTLTLHTTGEDNTKKSIVCYQAVGVQTGPFNFQWQGAGNTTHYEDFPEVKSLNIPSSKGQTFTGLVTLLGKQARKTFPKGNYEINLKRTE